MSMQCVSEADWAMMAFVAFVAPRFSERYPVHYVWTMHSGARATPLSKQQQASFLAIEHCLDTGKGRGGVAGSWMDHFRRPPIPNVCHIRSGDDDALPKVPPDISNVSRVGTRATPNLIRFDVRADSLAERQWGLFNNHVCNPTPGLVGPPFVDQPVAAPRTRTSRMQRCKL